MANYRVAVLRGGPSEEYDVSMQTGAAVISALSGTRYTPIDVIISRGGRWLIDGFEKQPTVALEGIDVAFVALHGAYGEDGKVQRLLERLSVPFTGSGSYASSMALNKLLTKDFLRQHNIKMPRHMRVSKDSRDISRVVHTISTLFGPEYVIKPVSSGSSLGVTVANGTTDLLKTLQKILSERDEVMVEERISGREATVGIVERFRDTKIYALPPVEIIPPPEVTFFDYENKYNGKSDEICPSRFDRVTKKNLEEIASLVHSKMGLSQYSRSDFMIGNAPGEKSPSIYFLEVNTLPGLTSESLLPKALSAVGYSYGDFVAHLLDDTRTQKR